ncbi:Tn3 family transposase [Streptomyces violens]|uniref:Tn3 family transposase n=1 Tax=Streptomyces violens TaxID=66377 RepID=UPI0004C187BE|nr:Tn3 family transposase [Streptomyces violens]
MTAGLDRFSASLADGSAGGVKAPPARASLGSPFRGFTEELSSVAGYERIERDVPQRRLLLALFVLGTNMGIRVIVATGEHGEGEAALRHVCRHVITVDNLRAAVTRLVNSTFAARDAAWRGRGTACAWDSKKFGSWSSSFMTENHASYGGNGVIIYWHVERKDVCIHSQLKSCSSADVAAMIEGAAAALHRRRAMPCPAGPRSAPRWRGTIRWELIEQQGDQMVKYGCCCVLPGRRCRRHSVAVRRA